MLCVLRERLQLKPFLTFLKMWLAAAQVVHIPMVVAVLSVYCHVDGLGNTFLGFRNDMSGPHVQRPGSRHPHLSIL